MNFCLLMRPPDMRLFLFSGHPYPVKVYQKLKSVEDLTAGLFKKRSL